MTVRVNDAHKKRKDSSSRFNNRVKCDQMEEHGVKRIYLSVPCGGFTDNQQTPDNIVKMLPAK